MRRRIMSWCGLVAVFLLANTNGVGAAPILTLMADGAEHATLAQGQPLVLVVSLADFEAQLAAAENAARKAHLQVLMEQLENGQISESDFEMLSAGLEPLPITSTIAGSPSVPWYDHLLWQYTTDLQTWHDLTWPLQLLKVPLPEPVVTIDDLGMTEVAFGLDPEETSSISVGEYTLRAGLESSATQPKTEGDMLWANTIRVTFLSSRGPSEAWPFEDRLWLAFYWLRRGEPQKALDEASALVEEEPGDINAMQIKADALAELGRVEEAIEVFLEAIAVYESQVPRPYEPPDYLIERYLELLKRLDQEPPQQEVEG